MIKTMGSVDYTARAEAEAAMVCALAMSNAMGAGPTTPDYQAWWDANFTSQFVAHNVVSAPVARTLAFATAYQATTPTKPALIRVILRNTLSIAIGSAASTVELIQGPTSAVAGGTGDKTDTLRQDLSVTLITIGLTTEQSVFCLLPVGHFFALRRPTGTSIIIVSATDQSFG